MSYLSSNSLTREQLDYYFSHQLAAMEREYKDVLAGAIASNHSKRNIFIGEIVGFDEKRGNLLVRILGRSLPRLDTPYSGSLFKGAPKDIDLNKWQISYAHYLKEHKVVTTEATPIFFLAGKGSQGTVVGLKGVESELINKILPRIKSGQKISFMLAKQPPPFELVLTLRNYVKDFSKDNLLTMPLVNGLESWAPRKLSSDESATHVLNSISNNSRVIVQGPPGTGKSFLISEVIYSLQAQGSRICVAAQSNKTVSELCRTAKMSRLLESGKIYKNSIKSNESVEYPNLKSGKDHFVAPGDVLLSTFFSLKERVSALSQNDTPEFDIVIIEEASQANLALISALYRLAPRTLLVGDPMQMAPIVLESRALYEKEPKYRAFSSGLTAVASNTKADPYMLTESYRLNPKGASQTGIFYDSKLVSRVSGFECLKFSDRYRRYFDPEGGAVVSTEFVLEDETGVEASLDVISRIIEDITSHNSGIKIALLSPYIRVVNHAQSKLSKTVGSEQLLVETIDRIQGITVDFAIILVPLTNPLFATELERFNVATSRARLGNLIFISPQYQWLSINDSVKHFLDSSMMKN